MSKTKDYVLYSVKKIERYKHDEKTIIEVIQKLNKVAVTAELLQETGAFSLMKDLSLKGGKVGEKAQPVYNKWKLLISIAMKNRLSPIRTPEQTSYDKPSSNKSSSFSKSSADSYRSRDSDYGRSSKYPDQTRRDHFAPDYDSNRPDSRDSDSGRSSKYSEHNLKQQFAPHLSDSTRPDHNGVNVDNDVDGAFNPHLSIEHSEKSFSVDDGSDQNGITKSSRIREPYHIEMREGMFRAVKNDSIDKSVLMNGLRACEFIERELIQQKQQSYKLDRDRQSKHKNSDNPAQNKQVTPSKEKVTTTTAECSDKDKSKKKLNYNKNPDSKSKTSTPDKLNKSLPCSIAVQSNVETRRKSSPAIKTEVKETVKRKLSPHVSGIKSESKESDRKRDDKRLKPDHGSEHKLKIKPVEKERSPGHVSKTSQNNETYQTNCDKRIQKKTESPDSSALKFISSKKERKAIYSGKKSVQDVLSLQQSCVRVLRKNFDCLKCVRKVPYKALKPVLEVLKATQLFKIEEQNPHLLKHTDELWKQHCNRDYRGQVPGKSETWRGTYYKAHKELSRKLKDLTASISAAASKAKPDRQAKLTLVDSTHDPQRKRLKTSNGPIVSSTTVTTTTNNNSSSSKSSPSAIPKTCVPSIKSGSPHSSKTKEIKHVSKPPKKVDAPLMSKVKKSIGLLYRPK